ncbi:unnamed protein product [Blepharisma stoltei]|uniref:Uncharacterized protein n=1 Tax=Blepharisma stoltei TaxID=1481888 RepID=A0AAU9J1Z9_9CILI|nr:unnamed protein product [Blepharisma stoltei]
MESKKVRVWICGSWGYWSKANLTKQALVQELNLSDSQIECMPGEPRQLKVDVVIGGQSHTVISRKGADFFPRHAPMEIVEAVRKYF